MNHSCFQVLDALKIMSLVFSLLLMEGCNGLVGSSETIVIEYDNRFAGSPEAKLLSLTNYVTLDTVSAALNTNGRVDIKLEGVRIASKSQNFTIDGMEINENVAGEWLEQSEFSFDSVVAKTDIMVTLVLDVSSSIGTEIDNLKDYAKQFAAGIVSATPNSVVNVYLFSDTIVTYGSFVGSSSMPQLQAFVDNYQDYGSLTTLFGSADLAVTELESQSFDGSKSLVVFTDGRDNNTDNPETVLAHVNESEIPRFVIGVKGKDFVRDHLDALASHPNNVEVANDFEDLESVFQKVLKQVSSVYKITYRRSDQILDTPVKIRFRLNAEKIIIE